MANFFDKVLGDVNQMQEDLLGPNYDYWKQVNTPAEIGMSSDGNFSALAKDVGGLIAYVEMLVTGKGAASKTGRPLGDKFFLETGAKCKEKGTGRKAKRYIYINNVPTGSIPFISSGLGENFADFRGIIPGLMENVTRINPLEMFQSFMMPSEPECQAITLETINSNNDVSSETHHVATLDIKNMSPCNFSDRTNPVTGKRCVEAMTNKHDDVDKSKFALPDDLIAKAYMAGVGGLLLYLLYRLTARKK